MIPLRSRGFHLHEKAAKWLVKGVTYGPFRAGSLGFPFPERERVREDFAAMASIGVNAVRTYDLPNDELAEIASEQGLRLLIDVPWPKHLNLYDNPDQQSMCIEMMESAARHVRDWPNVMGVFLGNEIPADIARWAGERKVGAFLKRLYARAKEIAPETLFGYANYPSTEFLQLHFLDFLGFNVYLHDPEAFRNYLIRLRHLYPEKPIVLSELGMDTIRHGEEKQAEFLSANLAHVYESGLTGAFVFSWTDEWHAGGFDMEDWAFGIVNRERKPKRSSEAVARAFQRAPQCHTFEAAPKISVVVATYNGGRTLRPCLQSLQKLNYPNYEIVVVDDGSTDDTASILESFSGIEVVRQPNKGLSEARNAGIRAASGDIVAFTDSDCFVDPDWLYHLAREFQNDSLAGVGGPNLTPEAPTEAGKAVALAPGHATHVLIEHDNAEHVPGCNMAFRRRDLLEIGGFDPVFRKAGDDVDLAWRLLDLGKRIGFSTAGFVWHHRRPGLKAYLKQQIGYGEAEADLLGKHPHRFNDRGQSMWRGAIYAGLHHQSLLSGPDVHYGIFGSAGYQCIYHRPGSPIPYALTSLEWWAVCVALLLVGFVAQPAIVLAVIGIVVSLSINAIWAYRAWRDQPVCSAATWPVVWLLWILQPIVRTGARYWFRLKAARPGSAPSHASETMNESARTRWAGTRVRRYWAEIGEDRLPLVRRIAARLAGSGWICTPSNGWEPWDFTVQLSWWFKARVTSMEENHGERKRLLGLRYRLIPASLHVLAASAAVVVSLAVALQSTVWARLVLIAFLLFEWTIYRRACRTRAAVEETVEQEVSEAGFQSMDVLQPRTGAQAEYERMS